MSLKRFLVMLNKELIQIKRDRRIFFLIFLAPIIQLIIFGYAINLDVNNIETGILDLNHSCYSEELIDLLEHSDKFNVVGYYTSIQQLEDAFKKREIKVGVVIPDKFSQKIVSGNKTEVLLFFDGTDSNTCRISLGYFDQVKTQFIQCVLKEKNVPFLNLSSFAHVRVQYNIYMKSVNFMMSGIIGSILLVVTMVLGSANLVREKETGTYEQLITTPLKSFEIIGAKILPFFVLGYLEVLVVVLFAINLFKVPFRGDFSLLMLVTFPFLLSTFGTGLFISSISNNQRQAMFTSVIFMIPNILLSGFLFPIENMPKIIQYLTYAIPLRYFLVIIRGIFMKGTNLYDFYWEAILLTVFGILIFLFSVAFTRKQIS